jgi:hypothetical protein
MPADAKITPIFTMFRRVRCSAGLAFGGSWFIVPSTSLVLDLTADRHCDMFVNRSGYIFGGTNRVALDRRGATLPAKVRAGCDVAVKRG